MAAYHLEGTFEDAIKLTGSPIEAREGVELGQIHVTAHLTQQGHLRGEWKSTIGTAGMFVAYPHNQEAVSQEAGAKEQIPEQFYTHNIELGSVSLYAQDVRSLINDVRKDFTSGRPITTYSTGGREVTKYAEDCLAELPDLGTLSYLKVHIQEPDAHGINRMVVVELRAFGINEVRAQGVNESWVIGKAEAIAGLLRRHQNSLITTYKKFGLNLNQLIFLAMLVAIPEIRSLGSRALFVAVVFLLLTALLWVHLRFIPNAKIRLTGSPPTAFARIWPTIVSWLFAVIASLAAAYLYTSLTSNAP